MYELTVEAEFSAAHRICGYQGPCERWHGHNYRVLAVVAGEELDQLGMLVDFRAVRGELTALVNQLDHQPLNEVEALAGTNPTSEHLARYLFHALEQRLRQEVGARVRVQAVTVYESPHSGATYRR